MTSYASAVDFLCARETRQCRATSRGGCVPGGDDQIGGERRESGGLVALCDCCGREEGTNNVVSGMAGVQWFSGAGGLVVAREAVSFD